MLKLKKQKIQELLDKQNAAIDADMVCPFVLFVNDHITSACWAMRIISFGLTAEQ